MAARTTYFFTRHGEAQHNVAAVKAEGRKLLDPELTDLGREQASLLGKRLKGLSVVVTSPLTRALQTTVLIVKEMPGVKVLVTALHTENGMAVEGDEVAGENCQRGRRTEDLREAFPDFDFSTLSDWTSEDGRAYFHPLNVAERIDKFKLFLRDIEGESILVVGHSGFYRRFLGGSKLKNCEVITRQHLDY